MKLTRLPVLTGVSILLTVLLAIPLAHSGELHAKNMDAMPGHHNDQIMDMESMQGKMRGMSEMMKEAHSTKDMNKRHELMRQHMQKMQEIMGDMNGMMSDNMPSSMGMEKHQKMMLKRMDMMQGMMEQMLKQQSMMLGAGK